MDCRRSTHRQESAGPCRVAGAVAVDDLPRPPCGPPRPALTPAGARDDLAPPATAVGPGTAVLPAHRAYLSEGPPAPVSAPARFRLPVRMISDRSASVLERLEPGRGEGTSSPDQGTDPTSPRSSNAARFTVLIAVPGSRPTEVVHHGPVVTLAALPPGSSASALPGTAVRRGVEGVGCATQCHAGAPRDDEGVDASGDTSSNCCPPKRRQSGRVRQSSRAATG